MNENEAANVAVEAAEGTQSQAQVQEAAAPAAQAHEAEASPPAPAEETGTSAAGGREAESGDAAQSQAEESEKWQKRLKAMEQTLLATTAQAAASKLGVPEARVQYALKMAELDGIDVTAADAAERVRAAIAKVIADVPELAPKAAEGTGSAGAFRRETQASEEDQVRQAFRAGL